MTSIGNSIRVGVPLPGLEFHTGMDHNPLPLAHEPLKEENSALVCSSSEAPVQENSSHPYNT